MEDLSGDLNEGFRHGSFSVLAVTLVDIRPNIDVPEEVECLRADLEAV